MSPVDRNECARKDTVQTLGQAPREAGPDIGRAPDEGLGPPGAGADGPVGRLDVLATLPVVDRLVRAPVGDVPRGTEVRHARDARGPIPGGWDPTTGSVEGGEVSESVINDACTTLGPGQNRDPMSSLDSGRHRM